MTTKPKDDLDAVREVVEAIKSFSEDEQKRIIKWACEKLGISIDSYQLTKTSIIPSSEDEASPTSSVQIVKAKDIKTFVESKNPKSDKHFAAVVAYYHQFEAEEKKDSITKKDIINATRLADWNRLPRPDQTLVNATHTGLLDNVSRGHYRLNSVGENLVAMVLPDTNSQKKSQPKNSSKKHKTSQRKKKGK